MKIISLFVISFLLFACDPYTGFGCIAPEEHPAVAHARSFSQDRLAFLYQEINRLRKQDNDIGIEYWNVSTSKNIKLIPENLKFLNAQRILPGYGLVVLADCMDEGIDLRVSDMTSAKHETV